MENQKKDIEYSSTTRIFLVICHLVSIGTNLILFLIFYLIEHSYKYLGLFLHIFIIILGIMSTSLLYSKEQNTKKLKKYKLITKYFSFFIYASLFLYLTLLIYMFMYKYDIDIFYFFAICIAFWGLFHLFLVIVIKSFIGESIKRKGHYGKIKNDKIKEIL